MFMTGYISPPPPQGSARHEPSLPLRSCQEGRPLRVGHGHLHGGRRQGAFEEQVLSYALSLYTDNAIETVFLFLRKFLQLIIPKIHSLYTEMSLLIITPDVHFLLILKNLFTTNDPEIHILLILKKSFF